MNTNAALNLIKFSQQLGIDAPSPVHELTPDWAQQAGVTLFIKRDDLLHPIISGNKWRKLSHCLANLPPQTQQLVSIGGGHSNHLHALAYVCHQLGMRFTALVRGYYPVLTPTLADIRQWGAELSFISTSEYRLRDTSAFIDAIRTEFPQGHFIPEGGSQAAALTGVAGLLAEVTVPYDEILCPVASGGTLAGLVSGAGDVPVTGIAVLKGEGYLEQCVNQLLERGTKVAPWQILHSYHQGGYAKIPSELSRFCKVFWQQHGVPLEPVYSGKLLWAVRDLVTSGIYPRGTRLLLLHTGGIRAERHARG